MEIAEIAYSRLYTGIAPRTEFASQRFGTSGMYVQLVLLPTSEKREQNRLLAVIVFCKVNASTPTRFSILWFYLDACDLNERVLMPHETARVQICGGYRHRISRTSARAVAIVHHDAGDQHRRWYPASWFVPHKSAVGQTVLHHTSFHRQAHILTPKISIESTTGACVTT